MTIIIGTKEHKFDFDPGFIFWPANRSVGSQGQSGKQLLSEKEIKFVWMNKK